MSTARRGLHAAEEAGLVVATREPGCKPSLAVAEVPARDEASDPPPLYGPIPAAWLLPVLRLSAATVRVAMACWLTAERVRAPHFELALGGWTDLGLSRQAAGRGLDALKMAGLVSTRDRPGRSPLVLIREPPSDGRKDPGPSC
jgi:DNA-binding transcriptional ArsR family regulator